MTIFDFVLVVFVTLEVLTTAVTSAVRVMTFALPTNLSKVTFLVHYWIHIAAVLVFVAEAELPLQQ